MSRSKISAYKLNRRFPTPESAQKYMKERRWGGKPECPSCGKVYLARKRKDAEYYRHPICCLVLTVRTSTIMVR